VCADSVVIYCGDTKGVDVIRGVCDVVSVACNGSTVTGVVVSGDDVDSVVRTSVSE